MPIPIEDQKAAYAELLINAGVNLQPGQNLLVRAEIAQRDFALLVVESAYRAGARFVQMNWYDGPTARARLQLSQPEYLDYLPAYEIERHNQMVEEGWARLSLTGDEFPDLLEDVDPSRIRQVSLVFRKAVKPYMEAMMSNQLRWSVAAVPTPLWAAKVYPGLAQDEALEKLWTTILATCRLDQDDPVAAWQAHDRTLKGIAAFMAQHKVQSLHFLDKEPGPDGAPATDLTIGMTDRSVWLGGSSATPEGHSFLPNLPTEEIFSTPHKMKTRGRVRTSKPSFPLGREVDGATFHFEEGAITDFSAETGQDVLEQFFEIKGARRLGEVALVDTRSPVAQADVLFYEILFDENAAVHMAFGQAYSEGVEGGDFLKEEELEALGVNFSDTHVDFMIGTPTMDVTATCADGSQLPIMQNGSFLPTVLEFTE